MQYFRVWSSVNGGLEVTTKRGKFAGVLRPEDQGVPVFVIPARQRPRQIADVGADPEILKMADIDNYMQRNRLIVRRLWPVSTRIAESDR